MGMVGSEGKGGGKRGLEEGDLVIVWGGRVGERGVGGGEVLMGYWKGRGR